MAMKQKPDESPDQWVRQTLGQLPNTPPPGSSFDTERVWAQLLPELQAAPVRRRSVLAWWMAAACLAGLGLDWFWLHQSSNDHTEVVAHVSNRKADVPLLTPHKQSPDEAIATRRPVFSAGRRPVSELRTRSSHTGAPAATSPIAKTIEALPQTPEIPTVAEVTPIVERLPEVTTPNVVKVMPKRRFRVVHENELRAEEESWPKLYHTEHFVRLGTGPGEKPVPDESHPTLLMPLTTKPNH